MHGAKAPTFGSFVGRAQELADLRVALDDACTGRGRLLLLSGDPGIGKTRLAVEIAAEAAARGMGALWGRCWEGDGAPAYWPWIQVIRECLASADPEQRRAVLESEHASSMVETVAQIVPELRALAPHPARPAITPSRDAEQARFRLFDSVVTMLKDFARLQPLLVLLDDLHDADYSSLLLLRLMAKGLAGASILIVGSYREIEVRRSPELSKHIGDLSREARSIPLAGLSQAEVAQFYSFSSGHLPDVDLAAKLHAATGGNPLYVDGIVRTLIADRDAAALSSEQFKIPHTLREAIHRRSAALSDETRLLLNIAAAIGSEFDADLCRKLGAVSREELNSRLDEACADGIVVALGHGRYRFAHALVRAAIYDALDTNNKTRLHGRIAEAIEEIHAQDLRPHFDELAHHFRASGHSEKAIDYSDRAAKAANQVFAYTVAAAHWRAALALSEGRHDARRAAMLFSLGRVASFHLDSTEGVALLEAALSLYRDLQDDEKVASTNATLGLALASQADYSSATNIPRALEYFQQALSWEGVWKSSSGLGWLYLGMAISLHHGLRVDEAIAAARQARQAFQREDNPAWVVAASVHAQYLVIKGRHREAAVLFDEVSNVAQGIEDPESFRSAMWYPGWCRMLMRDPLEAKRFFTIGMERPGLSPVQRGRHFEFLAFTELLMGDLARAKALAAEHRVNPTFLSAIAFREGKWEEAIELQLEMIEWSRKTGHRWDESNSLSLLVDMIRVSGDLARASEVLQQVLRSYQPDIFLFEIHNRAQGVLLAMETGRADEAVEHLQRCRAILASGEDWLGRASSVARAEGVVAAVEGRDFAPHFEQSVAILKRFSLPWEEADTLYYWGRALNQAGEYSDAGVKFDGAIEIYRRHGGGHRWIDRVEAQRHLHDAHRAASPLPKENETSIYRREGDHWAITYNRKTLNLRNLKGLAYIAYLLGHPGERVHVFDMVAAVEGAAGARRSDDGGAAREGLKVQRGLGDAGEVIDPRARENYRRRQQELRAELEEAQQQNDPGRAETARHELELLTDELNAALGRGGRARKSLAHNERARSLVTKHVRTGLELIRRHDEELADHLDRSIRTGTFCGYLPAASAKVAWQL
jgi:tetratricopeptide (TPR) repeat protein